MQLISHPDFPAARYYSLGEPGPTIQHVWFCLAGHNQPVAELAAQLVNLDTPERLLILPQAPGAGPAPTAAPTWFDEANPAPGLAATRAYLAGLTAPILAACPAGTPVTVLGCGQGAVAACAWLANDALAYDRLIFYAAVFPAAVGRAALFAALPPRPVVVAATTTDVYTPEAEGVGLVQDLQAAGLRAQLRYVDEGPLTLAALGAGGEPSGLRPH
jgi:predicted esterase